MRWCRSGVRGGRSSATAGARVAWALGAAVLAGLGGCSAATGPPTPAAAVAPAPAPAPEAAAAPPVPCTAATLSVALGPTEGAAGTVYAPLRFTNTGSRPCVTQGFPGVSYLTGPNGSQVGRAADRDGAPDGVVTLAPGEVASANLAMAQVGNFDSASCQPTPVRTLRVYPPNQRVPILVPINRTGCAGNPPGSQLRIATIKAGAGPN